MFEKIRFLFFLLRDALNLMKLLEVQRRVKVRRNYFADDIDSDLCHLRMTAHIIDKGLHHPDAIYGHGEKNYLKAKELLNKYEGIADPTYNWALGIVEEYELLQEQKELFSSSRSISNSVKAQDISSDSLSNLMNTRVSCRQYKEENVSRELLEKLIDASLQAPWSCSRQALRTYVVEEPKKAQEVLSCFRGFTAFSGSCVAIIYCVDLRAYSHHNELFVPHLDVGMGASYAALQASTLGLSMTFLSAAAFRDGNEGKLRTCLGIPDYEEIVVGSVCGVPNKIPPRPIRRDVNDVCKWR